MAGLYLSLRDDVMGLWTSGWTHTDVPVFWRSDDLEPLPDPGNVAHFLRNEVDLGREAVLAFGSGRFSNLRAQYGSLALRVFTARALASEDAGLELMADAMAVFRSKRISGSYATAESLSFIGDGSGFDVGPSEDGNWFVRGAIVTFEYRFRG